MNPLMQRSIQEISTSKPMLYLWGEFKHSTILKCYRIILINVRLESVGNKSIDCTLQSRKLHTIANKMHRFLCGRYLSIENP